MHLTDEEIIQECLSGRKEAYRWLYDKYASTMLSVCVRYAHNPSDAEDILQEGFMRVFDYLHQYKKQGSFEGWIKRIMTNTTLAHYRTKSPLHTYIEIETIEHSTTDHNVISDLETEELMKMINALPSGCKKVFNMFVIDGYLHKEIAEALGISEGTSKSQLSDARRILKQMIAKS